MRIVVYADGASQQDAQSELDKAMRTLRGAGVITDGGGLIGRAEQWYGAILLRYNDDAARALDILKRANITAAL